jgi:hypothetical protein
MWMNSAAKPVRVSTKIRSLYPLSNQLRTGSAAAVPVMDNSVPFVNKPALFELPCPPNSILVAPPDSAAWLCILLP